MRRHVPWIRYLDKMGITKLMLTLFTHYSNIHIEYQKWPTVDN